MAAFTSDCDALSEVVRRINGAHGARFRLGERLPSGEQGAYRLHDDTGAEFVLKWAPRARGVGRLPAVAATLERLREAGYPIPRYAAYGVLAAPFGRYTIQELLPGRSRWRANPSLVQQALALNDLQKGGAAQLAPPHRYLGSRYTLWRDYMLRLALRGGNGFCQLRAMKAYSPLTARLLDRVQEYIAAYADCLAAAPATDVVHFDFGGSNILVDRCRITGVVDWEGLGPGDRAFDLATFLFYDGYYAGISEVREPLWRRALELGDEQTFGIYLCHIIHRQADWSIRHHDAATVAEVLDVCDLVLRDVAEQSGYPLPAWR